MSGIRKLISGRQVNLFRQALTNEFQLSRDNVDFIRTPDGRPKSDQISTFYRVNGGCGIENLERMYLWDINPNYTWRGGIVRRLEAGTYIFYGYPCSDTDQVYIPSGNLCSTIYYGCEHESFSLEQGDFIVHPTPSCTVLMTQEDIDLFVLEYSCCNTDTIANTESPDDSGCKITVAMAMKQFSLTNNQH